jgi:hypothetical protein
MDVDDRESYRRLTCKEHSGASTTPPARGEDLRPLPSATATVPGSRKASRRPPRTPPRVQAGATPKPPLRRKRSKIPPTTMPAREPRALS